jgi:hypothetical protein
VGHDRLQQRRNRGHAQAVAQRLPGILDRLQRVMPAADHQPLGHRKTKNAELVGGVIERAHQVGECGGSRMPAAR